MQKILSVSFEDDSNGSGYKHQSEICKGIKGYGRLRLLLQIDMDLAHLESLR
jgi:hypothetical protein